MLKRIPFLFQILFLLSFSLQAQQASSWKQVQEKKIGNIIIYYSDYEGFISEEDDKIQGIEYDLMNKFRSFVEEKYQVKLNIYFKKVNGFSEAYNKGITGKPGEFFAASFSITPERLKEVQFTPAYLPDIQVMICSANIPIVKDSTEFKQVFKNVKGITLQNSTFETHLLTIKEYYLPNLSIDYVKTIGELYDEVEENPNYFTYAQLPDYLLRKEKGSGIKRQNIFKIHYDGLGIIYSKKSDWKEPIEAFFEDESFKPFLESKVRQYFGQDVNDLLQSDNTSSQDEIDLLTKEREMQSKQIANQELRISRQGFQIYLFIGISVVVAFLGILFFSRYQIKQKSNKILALKNQKIREINESLREQTEELKTQKSRIESQQKLIEERSIEMYKINNQLTRSIYTAQTIQQALLPFDRRLNLMFDEHFAIYLPKDIVSGDFYWVEEIDNKVFISVIDCTGHGVPGAFMTMIAYAFLNEIVEEKKIYSPGKVLESLHTLLTWAFQQDKNAAKQLGMDICICCIDRSQESKTKVTMASAKQNIYYYLPEEQSLNTITGERKSIGGWQENVDRTFEDQEVELPKGAIIYMTSDGFEDTPNAKRRSFGRKRLKQMLTDNAQLPLEEQKEKFLNILDEFAQGEEQRDDITILGIQV